MHDIDAFVDQQRQTGMSGATVKRRVAALKVFFDFLAEEAGDLSWPNPVRFKRHAGKPAQRLPRDLSNDQVAQLWATITSVRDRAWFALMLRAGLRVGEVVRLKPSDVVAAPTPNQPAQLRVWGKGQKERQVLLTQDAYTVLQEWLAVRPTEQAESLFLNQRGQPLQANGIEWLLKGYGQAAGVRVTPHQLRHTFARQLTEGGMPLPSLSKLLGHNQITTTQIYTAGADPALAQAYQQAIAQLERQAVTAMALPEVSPEPTWPTPSVEPIAAHPPDWATWGADLPAGLRQATVTFVQRRWPTWKAQRRQTHAQHLLRVFHRFWQWQLSQRPLDQPTELVLADLQAYQHHGLAQGLSPATIKRVLDDVLALLRQLAEQGQPVDPAVFRLHRLPRPASLPRHLSENEAQRLEQFVGHRLEQPEALVRLENACFFILAHTGLRASECVDLQVQDLDLAGRRLWVRQGKGLRDRVVYLSDTAHRALCLYLGGAQPPATASLFIRPDGRPINYMWLYQHIVALGQAAGHIAVTPHQLRHTLATRLLNAGMAVTRIQKILGHQHLTTTMIYARVFDKTVETDYRQAMRQIERGQLPLSQTPQLVSNWPISHSSDELVKVE